MSGTTGGRYPARTFASLLGFGTIRPPITARLISGGGLSCPIPATGAGIASVRG